MIARHLTATAPMLSDRHQVIEPGTRVLLRRGTRQRAATIVVQGSVSKNFNRAPSRLPTGKPHLIDAQVFDAAMLDINLNGNKSHPVADALAARGVPFVLSTGYSGLDMIDGYGDRPVLKKPFPYEELVEILTRLLSR